MKGRVARTRFARKKGLKTSAELTLCRRADCSCQLGAADGAGLLFYASL
jgi:hypothetical protein